MKPDRKISLFKPFRIVSAGIARFTVRISVMLFLVGSVQAQFSEKIIEEGKSATVRILAGQRSGDGGSSGSGFFISKNGHVATNHHVVEGADQFLAIFSSGNRVYMAPANLIATSAESDLAILQTRLFPGALVASLAVREPRSGQKVMAIGFPGLLDAAPDANSAFKQVAEGEFVGDKSAITNFIPTTFSGEVGKMIRTDLVAHSAKISEGNSGGPLIDVGGRVVGINTFGVANELGTEYSVSVHSSHLAALARSHGVKVTTLSSKVSAPGSGGLPLLIIVIAACLSVVTFLMVLRKPRTVLVEGMSRLVGSPHHHASPVGTPPPMPGHRAGGGVGTGAESGPPVPGERMILRGRDLEGRSYQLDFNSEMFRKAGSRLYLGRNRELCQLAIPQDSVSRQHAVLIQRDGEIWVEDRNSGNGTSVNGLEISLGGPAVPLKPGDRLTLGEVELVFDRLS